MGSRVRAPSAPQKAIGNFRLLFLFVHKPPPPFFQLLPCLDATFRGQDLLFGLLSTKKPISMDRSSFLHVLSTRIGILVDRNLFLMLAAFVGRFFWLNANPGYFEFSVPPAQSRRSEPLGDMHLKPLSTPTYIKFNQSTICALRDLDC